MWLEKTQMFGKQWKYKQTDSNRNLDLHNSGRGNKYYGNANISRNMNSLVESSEWVQARAIVALSVEFFGFSHLQLNPRLEQNICIGSGLDLLVEELPGYFYRVFTDGFFFHQSPSPTDGGQPKRITTNPGCGPDSTKQETPTCHATVQDSIN